jgi:oligoribonuclease NrnB/cAMP/cGMP phosphodiesterase (DHH superfamily)
MSRFGADVAVIVRSNGAASLRSRSVDVSVVARRLGGGGHPRAAGARIKLPLIVRLLAKLYPKVASAYVAGVVARALIKGYKG